MSSGGPSGAGSSSSSGPSGASGPSGQVSQSDTSLWLHNKLGTSNDSWTGGSIVSQLSSTQLIKIRDCFQDLQPQVKLKLLLSLFAIPRRNLEAWRRELEDILEVAADDSEPWVQMLSELMKTYPSSGTLNSDIHVPESNKKLFADLVSDMKKALKKSSAISSELHVSAATVLPIECLYLNKNAFISVVGHQPQHVKHFTLKRKPKAAAVRVDLLNKSAEAANKVKSSGMGGFPMRKSTMPRKMDSPALKSGLNRSSLGGGFRRPILSRPNAAGRKSETGGVKLLDITEQPVNAMARKRKRQQELEEAAAEKKKAQEQRAAEKQEQQENRDKNAAAAASNRNSATTGNNVGGGGGGMEKATPDYAAGLSAMNPPTPAPPPPPSYAPPTPTAIQPPSAPKPSYAPSSGLEPPPLVVQPPPAPQQQQQQQQPQLTSLQPMAVGATTNLQPQFQHLQPPPPPTTMLQQQQSTTAPTQTIALPTTPLPNSAIQSNAPPPTILQTPRPPFPANLSSLEPLPPAVAVVNPPQPQVYSSPTGPATQQATTTTTRIVRLPTQPLHPSQALPNQPLPPAQATAATNAARFVRTVGAPTILVQQPQQPQPRIIQQRTVRSVLSTLTPQPPATIQTQQQKQTPQQQPAQPQQPPQQRPQAGGQPQRRALTLTREQMVEAQEMFRTANRVTRPEKALILGFMAGSRDNPCPHLGNVVTIKLAENQENVLQQDGTYLTMQIETHFQMNYSTGEWNRIRKYRRLEDTAAQ